MARRSKGHPQIVRRVRICGPERCKTVRAVVDTGASMTSITEGLARKLGIVETGRGRMHTAGGDVRVWGGAAKVCLPDRGCGCLRGNVAVLPIKSLAGADVLVGQDYLEASRAMIDAAGRKIRCRLRRR